MMLAMCLATVAGLITSSSPMDLLLRPSATSAAISSSRRVSVLGGIAAGTNGAGGAGVVAVTGSACAAGGFSARPIAASGDISWPCAHSRATAELPRRRAGTR
jgi:hypothetical protein